MKRYQEYLSEEITEEKCHGDGCDENLYFRHTDTIHGTLYDPPEYLGYYICHECGYTETI
jgi:hypothetical protein